MQVEQAHRLGRMGSVGGSSSAMAEPRVHTEQLKRSSVGLTGRSGSRVLFMFGSRATRGEGWFMLLEDSGVLTGARACDPKSDKNVNSLPSRGLLRINQTQHRRRSQIFWTSLWVDGSTRQPVQKMTCDELMLSLLSLLSFYLFTLSPTALASSFWRTSKVIRRLGSNKVPWRRARHQNSGDRFPLCVVLRALRRCCKPPPSL